MRIIAAAIIVIFFLMATVAGNAQITEHALSVVHASTISAVGNEVLTPQPAALPSVIVVSPLQKGLGVFLSMLFLAIVLIFIRRQHLSLDYGLPWILAAIAMGFLAVFFELFVGPVAGALGITIPILLLFLIGIVFLLVLNFYVNVRLSALEKQIKNLAQEVGINKLELLKHKKGQLPPDETRQT
jgi:hypothetical protein